MSSSPLSSPPPRRPHTLHQPTASSIARGATARSAVSPKMNSSINGMNRRAHSARSSLSSSPEHDGSREDLVAALKLEREEKEELLMRLQNKEQSYADLSRDNDNLNASLNAIESRLTDLYADQSRMEDETAARLDLVDRLRAQVQELEREKRDVQRRYNEQTATFDAERQSFYDNEQHLKSRIQSLLQAKKSSTFVAKKEEEAVTAAEEDHELLADEPAVPLSEQLKEIPEHDEESEPAEMTSLRLELSTLSTSYSSLQNTVQHLSSQLLDLKRMNAQLQEENESYLILLRERTLRGQFDIRRTADSDGSDDEDEDEDEEVQDKPGRDMYKHTDRQRSKDSNVLDPVDETLEDVESTSSEDSADDRKSPSTHERERSRRQGRGGRRAVASSRSPKRKGESLADLPITGPGLDLAAELGRAENQAILDGTLDPQDTRDRSVYQGKSKKSKRQSVEKRTDSTGNIESSPSSADVDALRNEVKSLRDANKALSLYASKIIDRIIAEEGFEHVLAVDYDKSGNPPSPVKPKPAKTPKREEIVPEKKPRPQSAIFGRPASSPVQPQAEAPTAVSTPTSTTKSPAIPTDTMVNARQQRRSMSFDWKSFSVFGGSEKKSDAISNLRPLTLRPGAASVVNARKLDTEEDEEDRKERERMNATLKLMGFEKPQSPIAPAIKDDPSPAETPVLEQSSPRAQPSMFSFFRSRSSTSDNSSTKSGHSNTNSIVKTNLTEAALERAEAETTLAALDEREKALSAELAKGSSGAFTELPRRSRGDRSKRSRRSGESGSASTVWSAGMSTHREAESADEQG